MKKLLRITGISILILLLLALLIPVVFRKQIQSLVRKEINRQLNAQVDFRDVKLSLFRHFPDITISVHDLRIVGRDAYAGDTLLSVPSLDITAGLFSVIRGKDIRVNGLYATRPKIHLQVSEDGLASWDILKKTAPDTGGTDTASSSFHLRLKKYRLRQAELVYADDQASSYLTLRDFNHTGSGDLTADLFVLSTSTQASSASFTQDGIPYLVNTVTDLDADLKVDNRNQTYTFKTDDVKLNALRLSVEGSVQLLDAGSTKLDLRFSSPGNDFKDLLSMVPAMYTQDFRDIRTSGEASFTGFIKGILAPGRIPAYDVAMKVKNGSFQYPGLPGSVKNIQLSLQAANPDGIPDHSVIDISSGHMEFDKEPLDFHFLYKNPETIQYIDAGAKGKLDLAQVSRFFKLKKGTQLSGQVWADAFAKGPLKALQQQSGPFSAGGFFDIRNLYYSDPAQFPQPVKNGNMRATLQHQGGEADRTRIDISKGHLEVGNDPLDFSLLLSQPVTAMQMSGKLNGRITLDHLKQWGVIPDGSSLSGRLQTDMAFAGSRASVHKKEYDKIKLNGTAMLQQVQYRSAAYPEGISIREANLLFRDHTVQLDPFRAAYLGTAFSGHGKVSNLAGHLVGGQELDAVLSVRADQVDLNKWTGTSVSRGQNGTTAKPANATRPFQVPAGVRMNIQAAADLVQYDKVDYKNVTGELQIRDEKISFKNIRTDVLEGTAVINGSYSTLLHKTEPDIGFNYTIRDMDVQKAFQAYNTVQFLMPIGRFLSGKLNSELSLTGHLQANMFPQLNSLTGNGNLLLLQGVLKKFAPLEKLAAVLQIDRLKSISVRDIKNYIEFTNGKVLVKPFNLKIDDIEMQIGGFHGFDQSIDYAIQMKLPRSVMGSSGNNLVNSLAAKASSRGLPFKLGETVNLSIKMTGSIDNPSLGIDLKEMAGNVMDSLKEQAKDFVQAKLDSAKQKAKDSLRAVEDQLKQKIKDKLKEQVLGKDSSKPANPDPQPADSTPKKPGSVIKDKLKDIFNRNRKTKDSLPE